MDRLMAGAGIVFFDVLVQHLRSDCRPSPLAKKKQTNGSMEGKTQRREGTRGPGNLQNIGAIYLEKKEERLSLCPRIIVKNFLSQ